MDPDAHAALRAVAGALAPCATVSRSMFRPTRAIQSFSFQRWAPEPREITVTGFDPALMTVSRRCSPRRARFGGHSLHRNGRAPNLWRAVTVVGQPYARVPPTSRLEPSRLLCGETERRPDSSAPSTDVPHVDGLHQSSRSIRAHASERRLLQSSRPTDTPGALRAHRLRDLSAPLLSRESEKQQLSLLCQIG